MTHHTSVWMREEHQMRADMTVPFINAECTPRFEKARKQGEMAKYWLTDAQGEVLGECLQLHGGYGYMQEYAIAKVWTDAPVQRISGGTNGIMKELIS